MADAAIRDFPYAYEEPPPVLTQGRAVVAVAAACLLQAATALASESLEVALEKAVDSAPELVVLIILVVVFMRDRQSLLDTVSKLQSQALERMTAISEAHAAALRDSAQTNAAALHEASTAVRELHGKVEQLGIHVQHMGRER